MLDAAPYMRAGALQLRELPPLALYVHFPWCLKKCPYCDFNSHPQRADQDNTAQQARYVQALLADIEACLPLVWGRHIISIFMGGGTPSLFCPEHIEQFLSTTRDLLPCAPGCEITLEANPGTFEQARFAAFRAAGVTRLSIGVQSFNDQLLAAIGRAHDGAQARAAAKEAAQHFEQFNLDLMYALPGQSLQEWENDLKTALAFAPSHLSTYQLTLEEGTPFAKNPPSNMPGDNAASAMMDATDTACAAAGLRRYEVSAWAQRGCQCVHNLNYWQFGDYLGIGAGAHSKISFTHRIIRQERACQPEKYMQAALSGSPVNNERQVSLRDLPFEYMLGALRLKSGFYLHDFCTRCGLPPSAALPKLHEAERKGWLTENNGHWAPTTRGFDFLSDVQQLFLP